MTVLGVTDTDTNMDAGSGVAGSPVILPDSPRLVLANRLARSAMQIAALLGLGVCFEILARAGALGSSIPPITGALDHVVTHWSDYQPHAVATLWVAGVGLLLGTAFGCLGGAMLAGGPLSAALVRGPLVVAYCAPPVVLLPILISAFPTVVTRLIVIVVMTAYPMAVNVAVGLTTIDPNVRNVIHAASGGRLAVLFRLQIPHAVPSVLAGLQVAFPAAILGAMLAELAGGAHGLGLYLIGGVSTSNHELVWGIAWLSTSIAAIGYLSFGALASAVASRRMRIESHESAYFADLRRSSSAGGSPVLRLGGVLGRALLAVLVPVLAWWAAVAALGLNPIVMKGPFDVWRVLTSGPRAAEMRDSIMTALGSTLTWAGLGFAIGMALALVMAVVLDAWPRVRMLLLPVALLSQTVPLVALAPILLLSIGRGPFTLVLIGVITTFFPAFVMIGHGLTEAPRPLLDLVRSAGGGSIAQMLRVKIPHAIPYLSAAARLLAPRALLGTILGEYVATGTGVGFLIYQARGTLDFAMMWAAAVAAVIVSCVIFWLAGFLERLVAQHFAGGRR